MERNEAEGRPSPLARLLDLAGWLVVAAVGLLMLTQAFGWTGTALVATVQALTPYAILLVVPVTAAATHRGRDAMAFVASLVGIGGLILAAPVVFRPDQPPAVEGAAGLDVAAVNLLFSNPSAVELAGDLLERKIDVIVFSEYTAELQQQLLAHPLSERYPFKSERDGLFAGGIAVWSTMPIGTNEHPETANYSLDVVVDGPDGAIRVVGVHPPTPIFSFDDWKRDLRTIGEIGSATQRPTLVIGDFNASFWHPDFRDLLDRGFIDAHIAAGRGFSTSWPTDEAIPAFVRLDHALVGAGLVSLGVEDFDVPGSDHRGLTVSVAPAR